MLFKLVMLTLYKDLESQTFEKFVAKEHLTIE